MGGGRWALALALAARRQSLTQSLRRLYPGQKKQQHNTELVGWFVACFFKSHAAQQRHWFGQLAISHIKQQVVCPCSHTIKHGSKVKTKRLSFVASFPIHFEPRFEPLGWLCALYSSAAGLPHLGRGEIPDGSPRASASPLLLLKKKRERKCSRNLRGKAVTFLEGKESSALSKSACF